MLKKIFVSRAYMSTYKTAIADKDQLFLFSIVVKSNSCCVLKLRPSVPTLIERIIMFKSHPISAILRQLNRYISFKIDQKLGCI